MSLRCLACLPVHTRPPLTNPLPRRSFAALRHAVEEAPVHARHLRCTAPTSVRSMGLVTSIKRGVATATERFGADADACERTRRSSASSITTPMDP